MGETGGIGLVRAFLRERKLSLELLELPEESTRTSALAADALGCSIAEIAKSIVYRSSSPGHGIRTAVAVLSGDMRVDREKLKSFLSWERASIVPPEEVLSQTGFPVGGVPPFPHREGTVVVVDRSVMRFPSSWAAAGTTSSVMRITPSLLLDTLRYSLADIASGQHEASPGRNIV